MDENIVSGEITGNRGRNYFILALLIVCQIVSVTIIAVQKQDFHIDEIYSYVLSNSYSYDRLTNHDAFWNQWVDSAVLDEAVTVQSGERFAYSSVYHNNSRDAHPPLFYWGLHTVCSFFPNVFSMWFGIGLNLFFFAVSAFLLYEISKYFIRDRQYVFLPVAIWGFSLFASESTIFIRMYALMSLFTLLLVLLHLLWYRNPEKKYPYILIPAITFCGVFTHYYSGVFAFWVTVLFCFLFFQQKQYGRMFLYGGLQLMAILLLFILYPAAHAQITGSETNNIGNEVAVNFFNFSGWIKSVLHYCRIILTDGLGGLRHCKKVFLIWGLLFAAVLLWRRLRQKPENPVPQQSCTRDCIPTLYLFAIISLSIITIAKISFRFVYLRYVYNLAPLFILCGVCFALWIIKRLNLDRNAVFAGLVSFVILSLAGIHYFRSSGLLFRETHEQCLQIQNHYPDYPLLALFDRKAVYIPTGNFSLFRSSDKFYWTDRNHLNRLPAILKQGNLKRNGLLVMIWDDKYWGNGYDIDEILRQLKQYAPDLKSISSICDVSFGKLYHVQFEDGLK